MCQVVSGGRQRQINREIQFYVILLILRDTSVNNRSARKIRTQKHENRVEELKKNFHKDKKKKASATKYLEFFNFGKANSQRE